MSTAVSSALVIKVADEVWIATALLHREHPEQVDFSIQDVVSRVRAEGIESPVRPGIYVHVVQHCVANRPPNPGRYRMLIETSDGRRRLYRAGDPCHPSRQRAKITPAAEDIPRAYRYLLAWYRDWCAALTNSALKSDPLQALWGSGRELWSDEHADDYVRRLREGWE